MDPQRLRAATRQEHEATEALMPLMNDRLTQATYVHTLQTLQPLVASWEVWAAAHAPDRLRAMLSTRRRSQWIVDDLRAMGAGVAPDGGQAHVDWQGVVAPGAGADEPRDAAGFEASFLGAMYVMEGSTLGGRLLARHVAAALALPSDEGIRYFRGHGEATGAMWREVTERIAEVPEVWSAAMTEAARRAFVAFGDALRRAAVARESGSVSNAALTRAEKVAS